MSEHRATIRWVHAGGDFLKGTYSREHTWTFDGGVTVPASPSPSVLKPRITYGGAKRPAEADEDRLHHAAHEQCFIANSVKTTIVVQKPQS